MKSDVISIKTNGDGFEKALCAATASAVYRGLGEKDSLHLRLLAEELLGMAKQITGGAGSEFWVESDSNEFELHLVSHPLVTGSMRRELLKVSTSGKNEAAKGFTGKLRDIFNRALAPENAFEAGDYYSQGLVLPAAYYSSDPAAYSLSADIVTWSMQKYKAEVESEAAKSDSAKEKWDELEKSIVANVADEVRIAVTGDKVEMTVYKKF